MIFILEKGSPQTLSAGAILSVPEDGHETGLIYIYLLKRNIKINGTCSIKIIDQFSIQILLKVLL